MAEGLRIGRILIEGFKGFTETQEIEIRHRHVFLIGPNGNGKSSIIEAVRWGLFGSTNRPNDIVKNEGYAGNCRVEIDFLARDGKQWTLHRTLNPGGGGSRAALFDENRAEHSIRDVLPQMDSLNAGEGAHIIFSTSVGALRRQPEDLTAFERTVFDHLGLKHPRAMLSHLEAFLESQEEAEESLDRAVSEARRQIESRIANLQARRGRILASRPWSLSDPPLRQETKRKAQDLIGKIKGELEDDVSQLSLNELVDAADLALEATAGSHRRSLDQELHQLGAKLSRLAAMHATEQDFENRKRRLREADESLLSALDGTSMDALEERVQARVQRLETTELRRELGLIARQLLDRTASDGSTSCPICGEEREPDELRNAISAKSSLEDDVEGSGLRALQEELNKAKCIERDLQELARKVDEARRALNEMIEDEPDQELKKAINEGRAPAYRQSLREQQASMKSQMADMDEWLREVRTVLEKLREEADYHKMQRDLMSLDALNEEMLRVQTAYEALVTFGRSTREVRDAVESTLTEILRTKMPTVSEDLTSAFSALTKHPHFDCLVIDETKLPKLELCVASSSDSSQQRHPTGVLNGQAQSALALVPYFAFSQADETPTEVYLVLLDDPTRAFDREHIQILIERLAELGERVQVVVATQETEVFRDLLPKSFRSGSYVVVEPGSWSYVGGPKLATTHG